MITQELRVLLLSLRDWHEAGRLPRAFRRAGFHVSALTFPGLLITRSRDVQSQVTLPEGGTQAELIHAIRSGVEAASPTIVVPTDDAAVEWLQAVALTARRELPADAPLLRLLEDSLGEFRHHATLLDRKLMAALTERCGVRAPQFVVAHEHSAALGFAEQHGLPVVLKAEESAGGYGVAICRDLPSLSSALERFGGASGKHLREGLLVQGFVAGPTAMRAVMAWRGQVLSGLSAIKRETHPHPTSPSSVVEFIDHAEMRSAAQTLVAALGFSGFASLDFQLDADGKAHLIEFNPRPTPICHLGEVLGRDLCKCLAEALRGQSVQDIEAPDLPRTVALFPQEWARNAESPYLASAYHDVPWDDPDLFEASVAIARGQRRFNSMMAQEHRREPLRAFLASEPDTPVAD
jgi:predicted ATP-grasp superfamily ATP-dependent carboligase